MIADKPMDFCQTPHYAIDPLLPYLPKHWAIWESACGEGQIVRKLTNEGYEVIGTDVRGDNGRGRNFFFDSPDMWDCQVTNPPYSIKYDWLERSYQLEQPFALLLPVETLGAKTAQRLFDKHGIEVIFLDKRVNFKMPHKQYSGTAHFPTAWFTWRLNLPDKMMFSEVVYYPDEQMRLIQEAVL
jgi:hypothetical protein